ncbi:MAG: MBL fold metallo-hydrolase [Hyphomonadaceae bacterium]|nr:MBL fold metallo-hydrolase [Hyphomonadaceae bacterium]
MTDTLRMTLLGTGSSGGVPRIGDDWGVCDPNEPRNRRLRCSALVERFNGESSRPTRVLIDTAPDLREQFLAAGILELDGVVYTHDHADQSHGIDDLRPVAYQMGQRLPVYLDAQTAATLVRKFDYCFEGRGGYRPILEAQPPIREGEPFQVEGPGGPIQILPLRQVHGMITSLGFRIGDMAYCNDVSDLSPESLESLEGVHTFIIDALRRTPHVSHAHLAQSLSWAEQIGAAHTVLTNLHIDMDYRALLAELPDGAEPAYDGIVLERPYVEFPIM